ncbi:MAG: hypothetical protein K6F46_02020 [Desulfovibrio sp.]|nr:hypothetical protein [Desulfovibrio sp.]
MPQDALADVLANFSEALLPLNEHLLTFASVAGFVLVGGGLLHLARTRGLSTGTGQALCSILIGFLLFGLKALIIQASTSLFTEEACLTSQLALLHNEPLFKPYIRFAVLTVILLGLISIIRGLCKLREASLGIPRSLASAITHLLAGLICVNIVTFAKIFGATAGGMVEEIIKTLFSS